MTYPITVTLIREDFERRFRILTSGRAVDLADLVEYSILKESPGYVRLGRGPASQAGSLND